MMRISDIKIPCKPAHILLFISFMLFISLGILVVPAQAFFVIVLVLLGSLSIIAFPKTTLFGIGIFLIFQELAVYQFKQSPFLSTAIGRIDEAVILIAFIVLLVKNLIYKTKWKKTPIDIPLLALISIAVIGSVKSHVVSYGIAASDLFILLKSFFVFYLFYNLDLSTADIGKALKVFLGVSTGVLLLGFIDLIAPTAFRSFIHTEIFSDYRLGMMSAKSIFTHPSSYGWLMAYSTIICLVLFVILNRKKYAWLSTLFFLGLLSSMRFKPVLGVLAAILVLLILVSFRNKPKQVLIIVLSALVFGGIFGNSIKILFREKLYDYVQTPRVSMQARNVLYSTGFQIAKDYFPFGSGLGTYGGWISTLHYSPIYSRYGIDTVYGLGKGEGFMSDTFWPYIVGQFGFLGLFAYAWIIGIFIEQLVKDSKLDGCIYRKSLSMAALLVLVEALAETVADPVFLRPPQNYYIFMILGVAMSFKDDAKNVRLPIDAIRNNKY